MILWSIHWRKMSFECLEGSSLLLKWRFFLLQSFSLKCTKAHTRRIFFYLISYSYSFYLKLHFFKTYMHDPILPNVTRFWMGYKMNNQVVYKIQKKKKMYRDRWMGRANRERGWGCRSQWPKIYYATRCNRFQLFTLSM